MAGPHQSLRAGGTQCAATGGGPVAELSALLPLRADKRASPGPSIRPIACAEALTCSRPRALGGLTMTPDRTAQVVAPSEVHADMCGTYSPDSHALLAIQASLDRMEQVQLGLQADVGMAMIAIKPLPAMTSISTRSISERPAVLPKAKLQFESEDGAADGDVEDSAHRSSFASSQLATNGHLAHQSSSGSLMASDYGLGSDGEPSSKRFNSVSLADGNLYNRHSSPDHDTTNGSCKATHSGPHGRAGVQDDEKTLGRFNQKTTRQSARMSNFADVAVEMLTESTVGRRLASLGSATGLNSAAGEGTCADKVRLLAGSQYFDLLCGGMIMLNTILIGVETDYLTRNDGTSNELRLAQVVLNCWYIFEFCLRLIGSRSQFFIGPEKNWNMFDACLVATSVLDLLAESVEIGGLDLGRVVRAVRLARVMRTLRIVRLLRYLREFRKMVYAMVASIKTLFWSLILLLFVMYTFAIWLTQGVTDFVRSADGYDRVKYGDLDDRLAEHYGSLPTTIYTLYKSITAGMSWGDAASVLLEFSAAYMFIFIVFLCISVFGALNIVTSVFVESAMHSAQHSRELMVQDKLKDKEVYMKHLRTIFMAIDTDSSGLINEEELTEFIHDGGAQVQTYMEALELNGSNAHVLFTLLDDDNSGCIDYTEFCTGCLQLRGEATAFDVHCLRYDTQRTQEHLNHFMSHVEDRLELITRITADNRSIRMGARLSQDSTDAEGWTDSVMAEQDTEPPAGKTHTQAPPMCSLPQRRQPLANDTNSK